VTGNTDLDRRLEVYMTVSM